MHRRVFELANALKLIAQDLAFGLELYLVGDVLVVAAATIPEMRAARLDAIRGWLQDFKQLCASEAALLFDQLNAYFFPGQGKGHKSRFAIW
jgi:hypothetical protein